MWTRLQHACHRRSIGHAKRECRLGIGCSADRTSGPLADAFADAFAGAVGSVAAR
jgi:hypothetical protein